MTTTPSRMRLIAGLFGAAFMAAATLGLAGCNKRENPPTTTTTPPATDSMPASPPASAASQ